MFLSQGSPHLMTGSHKCMKAHSFHPTWDNSEWTWQPQSFTWDWLRPWMRLHHSPILLSSFPFHWWQSERTPYPINLLANLHLRLPRWLISKESTCDAEWRRRPRFNPWVGKIPWRRARQPSPVFLPGESPRTEKPGRFQSIGSQRVRHNWSDWACTSTQSSSHSLLLRELKSVTRSFLNNVKMWVWWGMLYKLQGVVIEILSNSLKLYYGLQE